MLIRVLFFRNNWILEFVEVDNIRNVKIWRSDNCKESEEDK